MPKMGKWNILGCKSQNLSDCSVVKKNSYFAQIDIYERKNTVLYTTFIAKFVQQIFLKFYGMTDLFGRFFGQN